MGKSTGNYTYGRELNKYVKINIKRLTAVIYKHQPQRRIRKNDSIYDNNKRYRNRPTKNE